MRAFEIANQVLHQRDPYIVCGQRTTIALPGLGKDMDKTIWDGLPQKYAEVSFVS